MTNAELAAKLAVDFLDKAEAKMDEYQMDGKPSQLRKHGEYSVIHDALVLYVDRCESEEGYKRDYLQLEQARRFKGKQ